MKGTGRWAVQDAAELGAPVPTIAASVEARVLSSDRAARLETSERLRGPSPVALSPSDRKAFVDDVRGALYAAKACAYAQGMNLLRVASRVRNWDLDLGELARIWKGGCIIRAQFLGRIKAAYEREPSLPNLLLDPEFSEELARPPGRVAARRRARVGRRRADAGDDGGARLLRQPPPRAPAREPDPGAARLLRRAHLRARRPPRLVPHRLAQDRRVTPTGRCIAIDAVVAGDSAAMGHCGAA